MKYVLEIDNVSKFFHGLVAIDALGNMAYTPYNASFVGDDSFEYFICDDGTPGPLCDTAIVTITIVNPIAGNEPPVATTDDFITTQGVTVTGSIISNDSDPDGGSITLSSISNLTIPGATATIANNQIVYNRAAGIATTDMFTYEVCDANNTCSTATVSVSLKSVLSIENVSEFDLNVYPNPATDVINIETNQNIESITLIDISGKIVKTSNISSINLQGLNKGVYFVSVRTTSQVSTKKITIQ